LANWKVGLAGAAVLAAGVAGLIWLNGDTPVPKQPPPDCDVAKLILETIEARGDSGAVVLALTARTGTTADCTFHGTAMFFPRRPVSSTLVADEDHLPDFGGTDVEMVLTPSRTPVAYAVWKSTCWDVGVW
jgi:hypothetical protein